MTAKSYPAVLLSLLLVATAAACGAPETRDPIDTEARQNELLGRGETIAEALCSGCHAIGLDDESLHAQAPELRYLNHNYPVEALAEPLAEGIVVGHPDMPEWQFEANDIDALLAYLETIQVPPRI